jgi:hypothetical protein
MAWGHRLEQRPAATKPLGRCNRPPLEQGEPDVETYHEVIGAVSEALLAAPAMVLDRAAVRDILATAGSSSK